jgi:catechol 2,3-dioxygenase-like lactoylglutathione lyase family enzyme
MPETGPAAAPPVSLGHFAFTVGDLAASHGFYAAFGLRPLMKDDAMAIFELRGGTHLLLFQRGGVADAPDADDDSPISPAPANSIDLMIGGRGLEELETFRAALIAAGIKPDPIPDRRFYGHYAFRARDPDGNQVTVSTSHASDQPI